MMFPEFEKRLNKILSDAGYSDRNKVLSDFSEYPVDFLKLPDFGQSRLAQLRAVAISSGYLILSPSGNYISKSMASKEILRVDDEIESLLNYKKNLEILICS